MMPWLLALVVVLFTVFPATANAQGVSTLKNGAKTAKSAKALQKETA
jgi:hypothetical protein